MSGASGSRSLCAGRDERLYVGPDNGLLLVAADRLGGVAEAVEIAEAAYMLDRISHTFHGRDIFSPAAAHLASGVELAKLGPALDPAALQRLEFPEPAVGEARIRATVLYVDRYGNVQLNLTAEHLARVGIEPGTRVEVEVGFERYFAVAARTFADARMGDIVALRGRLREHRARHQPGERGAACSPCGSETSCASRRRETSGSRRPGGGSPG